MIMVPNLYSVRDNNCIPKQNAIPGILIEGTDYAGKTTLAWQLIDLLERRGISCTYKKDFLNDLLLIRVLGFIVDHLPFGTVRNLFYHLAMWLDVYLYKTPSEFIIQDRHWLSVIAETQLFNSNTLLNRRILDVGHIPFRFNVFLTSLADTRRERFSQKLPESLMDVYLANNPSVHEQYDRIFFALLPSEENWLVLSTDDLSPRDLAQKVLAFLQQTSATPYGFNF